MTIIEIQANANGQHRIESQSGRKECWLAGYIEVPAHLEAVVWESLGWCELTVEDGKLVGVTPAQRPEPEPVPQPISETEQLRADVDYIAAMTGVSL